MDPCRHVVAALPEGMAASVAAAVPAAAEDSAAGARTVGEARMAGALTEAEAPVVAVVRTEEAVAVDRVLAAPLQAAATTKTDITRGRAGSTRQVKRRRR